ncbi:MAG: hypothetical protein R2851_18500 [Caldilineaceae bacterium]
MKYLYGLISPVESKNSWQLDEAVGDKSPDATNGCTAVSGMGMGAAMNCKASSSNTLALWMIGIVNESGFLEGREIGVFSANTVERQARQRTVNWVSLTYATPQGYTFLDRRLYLSACWCDDPARCADAKIPADIVFGTAGTGGADAATCLGNGCAHALGDR